jgi:hypothetical protein
MVHVVVPLMSRAVGVEHRLGTRVPFCLMAQVTLPVGVLASGVPPMVAVNIKVGWK